MELNLCGIRIDQDVERPNVAVYVMSKWNRLQPGLRYHLGDASNQGLLEHLIQRQVEVFATRNPGCRSCPLACWCRKAGNLQVLIDFEFPAAFDHDLVVAVCFMTSGE
jgi:hypothetical protein